MRIGRQIECARCWVRRLIPLVLVGACVAALRGQDPRSDKVTTDELQAAIPQLGSLDYATRTSAARVVRRAPAARAVPALIQAVSEQADGYVRFQALVLLSGFNDPRAKDAMRRKFATNAPARRGPMRMPARQ